jgi:hypothetical protein
MKRISKIVDTKKGNHWTANPIALSFLNRYGKYRK